jgi:hypothetical protein
MGSGAHGGDDEHSHVHGHAHGGDDDAHAHGHGHSHGGEGGDGGGGEGGEATTTTATPLVVPADKDGLVYYQAPDGRVLHSHDGCVGGVGSRVQGLGSFDCFNSPSPPSYPLPGMHGLGTSFTAPTPDPPPLFFSSSNILKSRPPPTRQPANPPTGTA